MPFIPAQNCAKAAIKGTLQGVDVVNVLRFVHSTYPGLTELQELADAVDDFWAEAMLNLLGQHYTYTAVDVVGLTLADDYYASANAGSGAGGVSGGGAVPNNVTLAIKFTSDFIGRNNRGRVYMPGLRTSMLQTNENFVLSTVADGWVAAWESLEAALPAGWAHAVVSYVFEGTPRISAAIQNVTGYSYTDLRVDSQRRRLP